MRARVCAHELIEHQANVGAASRCKKLFNLILVHRFAMPLHGQAHHHTLPNTHMHMHKSVHTRTHTHTHSVCVCACHMNTHIQMLCVLICGRASVLIYCGHRRREGKLLGRGREEGRKEKGKVLNKREGKEAGGGEKKGTMNMSWRASSTLTHPSRFASCI